VISRTLMLSAALLLFSGIPAGHAQDTSATSRTQSDSLGDAARQARAEKPHSTKPAKVLTNDDVHGIKYSFSKKAQPTQRKAPNRTSSASTQPQR